MTPCRRGEVILVKFPNANLVTYKKRPALVVQDEAIDTGLPQRIVACITSNLRRTGVTRIHVSLDSPEGRQMGLLMDSVIVIDNLVTVQDQAIERVIGSCPMMLDVEGALRVLFRVP